MSDEESTGAIWVFGCRLRTQILGVNGNRNPFFGDAATKNKDLINTLFNGLMEMKTKTRDKAGKAFTSDFILDGTLSVPAAAPVVRYYFIPRDSLPSYVNKGRVVIVDFLDQDFKIGYRIMQDAKGTAKTVNEPAKSGG